MHPNTIDISGQKFGRLIVIKPSKKRFGKSRSVVWICKIVGNVVACCSMCNQMKWNYSKKEFLEQIKRICEFNEQK